MSKELFKKIVLDVLKSGIKLDSELLRNLKRRSLERD